MPCYLFILGTALPSMADGQHEIPFKIATVYFELNNTDGDLGIHALIDGEPWKKLQIEAPPNNIF